MNIPLIPTRHDHKIHIHSLLRLSLPCAISVTIVSDKETKTLVLEFGNAFDGSVVQEAVGPEGFVLGAVDESLGVEFGIDFFEEFEAYDAVVCGFVGGDCGSAGHGVLGVVVVDALGVEDFVDAGEPTISREG